MPTLAHAIWGLRRWIRTYISLLITGGMAFAELTGFFRLTFAELSWIHGTLSALWGFFFLRTVYTIWHSRTTKLASFELSALSLVGIHALVQLSGGLTGPLYPLVLIFAGVVSSFAQTGVTIAVIVAAIGLEAGVHFFAEAQHDPWPWVLRTLFIVAIAGLGSSVYRAQLMRLERQLRRKHHEEKKKSQEEVRLFRLVAAPSENAHWDEERFVRSSVAEVHQSLYHTLDLLKKTLDLHTCLLLLVEQGHHRLSVAECVSDSDLLADGPFALAEGVVGAVATRGVAMNLEQIRPGYRGLCYYQEPSSVRTFLGVPVMERTEVRGVLCADRVDARAFGPRDEAILHEACKHIMRILENERVFAQLERSKHEQSILYRASQQLGSATTEEAVIQVCLSSMQEIAHYDFAAVTHYDAQSGIHLVRRAVGNQAERFANLRFADNHSLTAMVVKNRHYLPYRGEFDDTQQVVYTKRHNLNGMCSLLILPLSVGEKTFGTLAVAARRKDAFSSTVRTTLAVLSNQVAVSLSNAASIRRLEELATTDGLTGCLNKRAFLQEFERKLHAAERFGRRLSLLVTDIDHFKNVNDTHGHAAGDIVLKRLGQILRDAKRQTDVVARFGGEEFCVLCEETPSEGANNLAERIREELSSQIFQTEVGTLRVTCSVGLATFPRDAKTTSTLFEMADQALYAAKRSGRNRVCLARAA